MWDVCRNQANFGRALNKLRNTMRDKHRFKLGVVFSILQRPKSIQVSGQMHGSTNLKLRNTEMKSGTLADGNTLIYQKVVTWPRAFNYRFGSKIIIIIIIVSLLVLLHQTSLPSPVLSRICSLHLVSFRRMRIAWMFSLPTKQISSLSRR